MDPKAHKPTRTKSQKPKVDDNGLSMGHELSRATIKAFVLLGLAVASSSISQLALSPVYGSIPASIYHQRLVVTSVLLAIATQSWFQVYLTDRIHLWTPYIPVIALVLPINQTFLLKRSARFGPSLGPILTEICTIVPILYVSVLAAIVGLRRVKGTYSEWIKASSAGIVSFIIIIIVQSMWSTLISRSIGRSLILSRSGLQYVIAAFFAICFPSKQLGLAIVLLLYPLSQNSHLPLEYTTTMLNRTLQTHGFSLVARQESSTGYISVLENMNDGFRVMRCDHSLLGGEWIDHHRVSRSQLGEPVYSCFVMLEAVRLVEADSNKVPTPDNEKHALVM